MLLFLLACADKVPAESEPPPSHRALIIGVDGTRGDAFGQANTPNLDAAFADGALTLTASTQLTGPTVSGPGWTSILTGREVEDHHVIDNDTLLDRALPTFPELVQQGGAPAAVVPNWVGIVLIVGAENVETMLPFATDAEVGSELAELITEGEHDLYFAHFDDVDHAGHQSGFSPDNPDYIAAIEGVDGNAAAAIAAAQADTEHEWLIVLCTDHGGSMDGHGALDAENRTIPLAMTGGGITSVPANPNHMDVAVTVMDWFGGSIADPDGQSWLP